jgi:hypothetical protein
MANPISRKIAGLPIFLLRIMNDIPFFRKGRLGSFLQIRGGAFINELINALFSGGFFRFVSSKLKNCRI